MLKSTLIAAVVVAAMASEADAWGRGGPASCPGDLEGLVESSTDQLDAEIAALRAQLAGETDRGTRARLRSEIRFLESRQRLLGVADRRLSRGHATQGRCAAIEHFIRRVASPAAPSA